MASSSSFSKKCASGLKSAPNSDSFWVRRLFNVKVRVFCAPNATILLVYTPAKTKIFSQFFFNVCVRFFCAHLRRFMYSWDVNPKIIRGWLGNLNQLVRKNVVPLCSVRGHVEIHDNMKIGEFAKKTASTAADKASTFLRN